MNVMLMGDFMTQAHQIALHTVFAHSWRMEASRQIKWNAQQEPYFLRLPVDASQAQPTLAREIKMEELKISNQMDAVKKVDFLIQIY
jgi:hypothetical protein